MSETVENQEIPGVHYVVPATSLQRAKLNKILSDTVSVDCHDINNKLREVVDDPELDDAAPIHLMIGITSYHVDPDNSTEPFKPMFVMQGRRALTPSDLMDEQIDALSEITPQITNAGLRARLADVVWFSQRRRQDMAKLAIDSYCDCIEQVKSGSAIFAFEDRSPWGIHAKNIAIRAARISNATGWKFESSDRLKKLLSELVSMAGSKGQANNFIRIVDLAINYRLLPLKELAKQAEDFATRTEILNDHYLKSILWQTAARCWGLEHDNDNQNRCMKEFAKCYMEKADSANSAMVAAKFLQDAIQVLRNLPGTKELREEITNRLHQVRLQIKDEMGIISTEVDLSEFVERSIASVRGRSWPTALLSLILCGRPPHPDSVRAEVMQLMEKFPLQNLMPTEVFDSQGRVKFRTSGSGGDAKAQEEHLRYQMSTNRSHGRQVIVTGAIDPIRKTIAMEHPISVEVVLGMIGNSPFIPLGHEHIFARGIVQFLGGCDLEAGSLLVPQLENSLRHILSLKGVDTTTSDEHGIQTEASLSTLLSHNRLWRGHLEEILPANCIQEIDLLFNFAGGSTVRNEVAHGKIPAAGFWHHDLVYAVWLVIHLTALPLAQNWGNVKETYARIVCLDSSDENEEN